MSLFDETTVPEDAVGVPMQGSVDRMSSTSEQFGSASEPSAALVVAFASTVSRIKGTTMPTSMRSVRP